MRGGGMSWVCVNLDGSEGVANVCPLREYEDNQWLSADYERSGGVIELPTGAIERLIGYPLTWEDEPYQIFDDNLAPRWKIDEVLKSLGTRLPKNGTVRLIIVNKYDDKDLDINDVPLENITDMSLEFENGLLKSYDIKEDDE
jgi:hypothetical protein